MIKEEDLQSAIAECQGTRNPNANTCLKLASYYTILDHTKKEEVVSPPVYSYAGSNTIDMSFSDSEFAKMADNKPTEGMLKLMDELMSTLRIVNPRLYASVMRKMAEI